MKFKDYYKTLGVAREASAEDVKRAYRRLARKYHPDVSKEPNAEQHFKEIQEAYEVLKDPEKRTTYNNVGNNWKANDTFRPPPNRNNDFAFHASNTSSPGIFSDFFETLFGNSGHSQYRYRHNFSTTDNNVSSGKQEPNSPPNDHQVPVYIDLEDSFNGTIRELPIPEAATNRHEPGKYKQRILKVTIPAGVIAGQRIRLTGQGIAGFNGHRGDLYLEVAFNQHRLFKSEQRDIYLDLPITPWEAALGRTIAVPTLGGNVDLKLPAGIQSGTKLRLKGRGLPGNPPGDQFLNIRIMVPKANTQKAREFYERMEKDFPMNPRSDLR
ncbi:cytochrome C biogenesis protein [Achromatium sp. WMS2]|nr:cytochrome C biogenesis protein [Achromatium sp. WMS2]